jgi:RibD C-terminal domain
MAKTVLDMSMSLDGFISGPQDDAAHPMGLDGHRLHDWLADGTGDPATYRPDCPSGEAFDQAKAAAGDRNVLHGAATAQQCLRAGLLDEMEVHVVPVLLGRSRRLFDHLGADHIELEPTRVVDAPGVIHPHYRVRRKG